MKSHTVFDQPDCQCDHCLAVIEEWTEQAIGFEHWLGGLTPEQRDRYFGPEGVASLRYVSVGEAES